MGSELLGIDCFMRYRDKKGATWVQAHRVIAGGRFVESQRLSHEREGGIAEQITREEYEKTRK